MEQIICELLQYIHIRHCGTRVIKAARIHDSDFATSSVVDKLEVIDVERLRLEAFADPKTRIARYELDEDFLVPVLPITLLYLFGETLSDIADEVEGGKLLTQSRPRLSSDQQLFRGSKHSRCLKQAENAFGKERVPGIKRVTSGKNKLLWAL